MKAYYKTIYGRYIILSEIATIKGTAVILKSGKELSLHSNDSLLKAWLEYLEGCDL